MSLGGKSPEKSMVSLVMRALSDSDSRAVALIHADVARAVCSLAPRLGAECRVDDPTYEGLHGLV